MTVKPTSAFIHVMETLESVKLRDLDNEDRKVSTLLPAHIAWNSVHLSFSCLSLNGGFCTLCYSSKLALFD